ncbi:uncharacterized protein LOC100679651 [Nasonia vitripennis]|uniref:Transposase n=1 Tax=Nasonia vitripennis TaxID=7425 RepID=A0A7M7QK97_NASVI|nr:uncharacterized protein LOC100679651 [Nasonia vitripennis]
MWAEENPHWFIENDRQHRWKVNLWVGIVGDRIVGPIFYDRNLTARRYRNLLRSIRRRLNNNPVALNRMWWQMDGAPAHNAAMIADHLDELFPERWIGLNSPHVRFPPRSPDLTIMDYYLFGNLKRICYAEPTTTADNMKQRIRDACAAIRPGELRRARLQLRQRFRMCIERGGGHFQQ